jgi:hypothetical protein
MTNFLRGDSAITVRDNDVARSFSEAMRQANEVEDFDIITSDVFGPGNNDFSGANMTGATERAFVRATDRQLEELRETIAAAPEVLALSGLVQSIPVRHSDL